MEQLSLAVADERLCLFQDFHLAPGDGVADGLGHAVDHAVFDRK